MPQTLSIILNEVLVISILALLVLQYLNWRHNRRRHKDWECLIDQISELREQRQNKLLFSLTDKYQLSNEDAADLMVLLYSAEKQFLLQFIERQMHDSVEGFYENLCVLLDNFLNAIPPAATKYGKADYTGTKYVEEMAELPDIDNKPPEPDWGDVFD